MRIIVFLSGGMNVMRSTLMYMSLMLLATACASDSRTPMERFVYTKDMVVRENHNISGYLDSRSGVDVENVKEVQPGVLEYSLIGKKGWLRDDPDKRCRYIFVVSKQEGAIIGWRYNGNPEYCVQSRG
jgi:hypothetical protein